ncbi:hypothetical protein A3E39_04165 [Candidatus Uhrbacteria bacterium RIFCSPHIGHO2_12_FULL_60_25]|uniref:Uncharacterized protein n=1 Tax=Candidatus Uhrbacteria bacterium RIFCSPHIGHO2_12_FULL_60_25 TaxID=1802399 RepID=A0A1F7ULI8_9BACT|nr:MAG: hypothetical protein A3D73_02455 [Candidatus Uhrbacteria bacterium RIFCSPHIGHO2_02_FULL_60_44]OGL79129.1 MAG: hypothetical protein A3E39_04165 [Candidatus Uhrbacteria bacterium RIFCSPHIGHO2_12_FULL_60_25]
MSKKNIIESALEGRASPIAFERRETTRVERMTVRAVLRKISVDPSLADELPLPERDGIYRDFSCRATAASRWLARKAVSLTAEEIRGLLMRSFDTRTFAGRHLVFDHLMPRNYDGRWRTLARDCVFDEHGVLIRADTQIRSRRAPKKLRIRARQWLATIAPMERIGTQNGTNCLFTATDRYLEYRPVRPLTADERSLWRALPLRDHDLERNP